MSWKPVVAVSLSVFAGTMATGAAEPELTALAKALAAPEVGARVAVEEAIEVGRGTIRPAPNASVQLLTAMGIPCGLWVNGPATFTYRVEDRFSLPVAQRNLKSASRLDFAKRDGALVITVPLEEAVVWGWGMPAALAKDAPPEETPEFSAWARKTLEKSLDGNPVRDMLLAYFNGRTNYRHALLRSRQGDDFLLDVDGRPHVRTEWLMRFDRLRANAGDFAGRLDNVELAAQPVVRNWWDPVARPFVITEVATDIVVKKPPRARVKSRVRIESLTDGPRKGAARKGAREKVPHIFGDGESVGGGSGLRRGRRGRLWPAVAAFAVRRSRDASRSGVLAGVRRPGGHTSTLPGEQRRGVLG